MLPALLVAVLGAFAVPLTTSGPATSAGGGVALAAAKSPPPAWQVLDAASPSGHVVGVMGGVAARGPAVNAGLPRSATGTPPSGRARAAGCLSSAQIRAGRGLYVRSADWVRGVVVLHLSTATCRGVRLAAGGGQYGFEVGARAEGTARRPNLPLFPQARVAAARWQSIAGPARDVTVHIPPVANQCTQNDVGVLTQGGVAEWPARMVHLGERQPQGIAYYVGNARGCYTAPSESAAANCPVECAGVTSVTFAASTRAPYGATTVTWEEVGSRRVLARLRVTAGRPGRVTVPVADGVRFQAVWQLAFGAVSRSTDVGGVVEVRCPPAPVVELAIRCLCAQLQGSFVDDNQSRYTHVMVIRVGQQVRRVVVGPHTRAAAVTLSWVRGQMVTVQVTSQLAGHTVGRVHTDTVRI